MKLPLFQVDAFTTQLFAGNPAAVCPIKEWLPDEVMQRIALENNLSETAFFVPDGDDFHIRWFTPKLEVDLCGHATLAAAHVLMEHLQPGRTELKFSSRSGPLGVRRDGELLVLDFPAQVPEPTVEPEGLAAALGHAPDAVFVAPYLMAVFASADIVRGLAPDFAALASFEYVIATAPGENEDFVSRFFAPGAGIDEDPVTGSAHCILTPYWAERLQRDSLLARQVSERGGELRCRLAGERVELGGSARTYLEGLIRTE